MLRDVVMRRSTSYPYRAGGRTSGFRWSRLFGGRRGGILSEVHYEGVESSSTHIEFRTSFSYQQSYGMHVHTTPY